MAGVRLSRRAVKDLDSLPKKTAARVLDALERLGEDPGSAALEAKALAGRRPWRRSRVGNYRIVFRTAEGGRILLVARIVDRKELEPALRSLPGLPRTGGQELNLGVKASLTNECGRSARSKAPAQP